MSTIRQPTLQTIANAAGVSRMTVSRALRNDPVLPRQTRERIQKLARELGYRPNPLVATLMSQVRAARVPRQTLTIAHVTTTYPPGEWRRYFFTRECIEGATARAAEQGFTLEEFCIKEPGMTSRRMSQILRTRG